jgi:hypothetical protein
LRSSLEVAFPEISFLSCLSAVKPGICVAEEWCHYKKSGAACLEKAPLSKDTLLGSQAWKFRLKRCLFRVSCQQSSLEFASPKNGVPKRNPFLLVSKKRRFPKIRYLAVEPGNCATRGFFFTFLSSSQAWNLPRRGIPFGDCQRSPFSARLLDPMKMLFSPISKRCFDSKLRDFWIQ